MKREKNITTNHANHTNFYSGNFDFQGKPGLYQPLLCVLVRVCSWLIILIALLMIACEKRAFPPMLPIPETQAVYAEPEIIGIDEEEADEAFIAEYLIPHRILVPYIKEYLSPGQETRIAVLLENADYGDEVHFEFAKEPGKNCIAVESRNNAAVIRAVKEGEQYLQISHPKAPESAFIVYDVLPPSPPPPPEIDVSESPLILRKDQTKPLQLILRNGAANGGASSGGAAVGGFQFQVIENAYAIEVQQRGGTLHITGIAPGAGKIRIQHPAALRDYDVMVIVD